MIDDAAYVINVFRALQYYPRNISPFDKKSGPMYECFNQSATMTFHKECTSPFVGSTTFRVYCILQPLVYAVHAQAQNHCRIVYIVCITNQNALLNVSVVETWILFYTATLLVNQINIWG